MLKGGEALDCIVTTKKKRTENVAGNNKSMRSVVML